MTHEEFTNALADRLSGAFAGATVFYEAQVDSTQKRAKTSFAEGLTRTVWVTREQSAGYGRMRRDFLSPATGLYFTFAMPWSAERGFVGASVSEASSEPSSVGTSTVASPNPTILTTAVATAMARVLARDFKRETQIKWVNDLYYEAHKVAGILTESIVQSDQSAEIFCGMGLNWAEPLGGFPKDLQQKAGSLEFQPPSFETILELLSSFFRELDGVLRELPRTDFLRDYEARLLGRGALGVLSDGTQGVILGVDTDGALRLSVDGAQRRVISGEVRLVDWTWA